MQNMFPTQNRMSPQTPQEILQHPHPPPDDRRILLGLARALDGVIGEGLFVRNGRDDEDWVEGLEGGAEGVEVGVAVVGFVVLRGGGELLVDVVWGI